MYKILVVLLPILAILTKAQLTNDDLLSVVVLYRHGDRAPIISYKYDVYDESYWPFGFGQLTNIGKKQQYALGKWFRSRYDGFLSAEYDNSNIKVLSSNVDRCLMSASINLAGLYPPKGDQVWNENLKWQPIPIHTRPESEDAVLAQERYCSKYKRLYSELIETKEFKSILESHQSLMQTMTLKSGKNVTTLEDVLNLYDTLYIEDLYNLTMPVWTRDVLTDEVKDLCGFIWTTYAYTTDLARLRSGPLIDLIVGHFENITSNVTGTPKFLMLSAHDSTIAPLLTAMQVYDFKWPQYTSTVIFELRQGQSEFVNIVYRNPSEPVNLTLPGCDFDCDLKSFVEALKPLRVNQLDWEEECRQG